jgi:hypothetical protein
MTQHELGIATSVVQSRRRVLQTAVALATMAVVGDHQLAHAVRGWCRSDPLIAVEDVLVDIFCLAPPTTPLHVTGPTEIVVSVPVGVRTALIVAGVGFGRGERVRFKEERRLKQSAAGLQVKVEVYVPADRKLPIEVEFAPRIVGILNPDRAEGVTNNWITLATRLPIDSILEPASSDTTPLERESSGQTERRARDRRAHPQRGGKGKRH